MSRFRILALFATVALFAAVLAACGGSSSEDPHSVLENATLKGIESGNLDLSLHVKSERGDLDARVSGPFQSEGKENLPRLDLTAKANGHAQGKAIDFEGGVTVLPNEAFVEYEGVEYEVDPTTFGFVKSSLEQAQQGSKKNAANANACQEAAANLKLGEFVEGLRNEGSVDVEGASTTKLSGELDVSKTIDALIKLTEDPACSAQLEAAGPLPLKELEEAREEASSGVKKSHVEVYVGDDHIIRKVVAELTVNPKHARQAVEFDLELSIGGVNEEQRISAPSGEAKPLQDLFQKLGVNPLELLQAGSSGQGLGSLIERLGSGSGAAGGESSGGGSGAGGSSSAGGGASGQKAYLECLQSANTRTDLQNCASLIR